MDIKIESTRMDNDALEVIARFTEGETSISKIGRFTHVTKEKVEQWLQNQAEALTLTMKTNNLFQLPETEKDYVYEDGKSIVTKTTYEKSLKG